MKNKPAKAIVIALLSYPLLVLLFESSLGYFQPETASTLQITTVDSDGSLNRRVLARLESDSQLYVAANHWPRAWYTEALANPAVQVVSNIEQGNYVAVSVSAARSVASRPGLSSLAPTGADLLTCAGDFNFNLNPVTIMNFHEACHQ